MADLILDGVVIMEVLIYRYSKSELTNNYHKF